MYTQRPNLAQHNLCHLLPTAVGHSPTAAGYPPTAVGQLPNRRRLPSNRRRSIPQPPSAVGQQMLALLRPYRMSGSYSAPN